MTRFSIPALGLLGFALGILGILGILSLSEANAACPQTQAWEIHCPLQTQLCARPGCPVGTACNQCQGDALNKDKFDWAPNPSKDTKHVSDAVVTCYARFKCKDKQGGGCETDQANPVGQPQTKLVYKTVDC